MDWVADTGFIGSGAYLTEDEYDDMGAHPHRETRVSGGERT
jgi:hypothetical protein